MLHGLIPHFSVKINLFSLSFQTDILQSQVPGPYNLTLLKWCLPSNFERQYSRQEDAMEPFFKFSKLSMS